MQFELAQGFAQFERVRRFCECCCFAVADEAEQLARGEAVAEEVDGGQRQVVCLVDDKRLDVRQDFRESLAFQGEIGEQQVVVDDGNVRFFRLLSRLLHEAFFKESAVAAKAVFGGGGDARQHRRVFRDFAQRDQITVGGFVEKALYRAPPRFFFGGVRFAVEVLVVVVVAEVVAPSFEQGDARGGAQHFAYQR